MGWTFPWASSLGGDFNFDFNVSISERQQRDGGVEYNYESGGHPLDAKPETLAEGPVAEFAAMSGTDVAAYIRERPGMSAFALEDSVLYHTYSTYARGLDGLWGMYPWLDRVAEGAQRDRPVVAPSRRVRQGLSLTWPFRTGGARRRNEHARFLRRAFFLLADATTLGDDHEDNPVQSELP